jgi:alpha-glucosidase
VEGGVEGVEGRVNTVGIVNAVPGFDARLEALYQRAKQQGLWAKTYALSNKEEYFAEAVQSFFNCNRYKLPADGIHCAINRRPKLKDHDPEMYALLSEFFYELEIPILNEVHR